ncbi:hypothetical protein [Actinospica robiniae]|uniref:hypothetical protein n=1 Tax=Actinospica robiniae TaxID=304901 RepID=UPI000429BF85|nr:hypothetical protein [Actinospica robiniae]
MFDTSLEATPFDTLRVSFDALIAQPCPMAVPAEELSGFISPARALALPEIRRLLMAPGTRPAVKRALWCAVVRRAQAGDASWTLAAAGLAYPGLAGNVLRMCRRSQVDVHEIQAEVLVEFLAALRELDVDDPRVTDVAGHLTWRAFYGTRAFRRREVAAARRRPDPAESGAAMPLFTEGHPDLVLARAVAAGVIDRDEADWISRTCLDAESASVVAREYGMGLSTFYRRRLAAGHKLAAAIADGDLDAM